MAMHDEVEKPYLITVFKEMWHLFLILAITVAIGIIAYLRQEQAASPEGQQAKAKQEEAIQQAAPTDQMITPSNAEQAAVTIAAHQQKLDADPKSPDAPGYLNAMANLALTRQLDYKTAAQYYERLIAEYPEFPGLGQVYIQLSVCYERLGDQQHVRWVYQQMMEKFPADSQEHLFAKAQLGL